MFLFWGQMEGFLSDSLCQRSAWEPGCHGSHHPPLHPITRFLLFSADLPNTSDSGIVSRWHDEFHPFTTASSFACFSRFLLVITGFGKSRSIIFVSMFLN
jgi:hypothetical protein